MNPSATVTFVIALAAFAANLPFANQRLFALIPVGLTGRGRKSFWWRLLELSVLYLVLGVIARLIEARLGTVFPQRWEFYAVTVCLFLVLGFPGFVYQYLRKAR